MLNPELEKLNARMIVLENLVMMLLEVRYVTLLKEGKNPLDEAKSEMDRFRQALSAVTFPGQEPAVANLRADEIAEAADRIFASVEIHLASVLNRATRLE